MQESDGDECVCVYNSIFEIIPLFYTESNLYNPLHRGCRTKQNNNSGAAAATTNTERAWRTFICFCFSRAPTLGTFDDDDADENFCMHQYAHSDVESANESVKVFCTSHLHIVGLIWRKSAKLNDKAINNKKQQKNRLHFRPPDCLNFCTFIHLFDSQKPIWIFLCVVQIKIHNIPLQPPPTYLPPWPASLYLVTFHICDWFFYNSILIQLAGDQKIHLLGFYPFEDFIKWSIFVTLGWPFYFGGCHPDSGWV